MALDLTEAELAAVAAVLRERRLDAARLDRAAVLGAVREYLRTVRYHLDPKLAPLKAVWLKLAAGEKLPPTPRLTLGPSRPRRR